MLKVAGWSSVKTILGLEPCFIGAIFGLFNRFSVFRYNLAIAKCGDCSACRKMCPVDIDPVAEMNQSECIRCHECTTTKHIKMGSK